MCEHDKLQEEVVVMYHYTVTKPGMEVHITTKITSMRTHLDSGVHKKTPSPVDF